MAGRPRTRHGRTCGAKTRKGTPCQCRLLLVKGKPNPNGRCKFHGGMAAGPKTAQGKARSAAAGAANLMNYKRRLAALSVLAVPDGR